jgi:hypothetical protein
MYAPEAQLEINKNSLVRTIDPTQTYFISNDGTSAARCRPELAATDPSDQLDKCHLDQSQSLELVFFDYGGIDAIRKIDLVKKLKWNTWHVSADHLNDLVKDNFRMIIMSNSDPNNL